MWQPETTITPDVLAKLLDEAIKLRDKRTPGVVVMIFPHPDLALAAHKQICDAMIMLDPSISVAYWGVVVQISQIPQKE